MASTVTIDIGRLGKGNIAAPTHTNDCYISGQRH